MQKYICNLFYLFELYFFLLAPGGILQVDMLHGKD